MRHSSTTLATLAILAALATLATLAILATLATLAAGVDPAYRLIQLSESNSAFP